MRDVNHISASLRVYPPSLRLRDGSSAEDYFRAAAGLREAADSKRKAMPEDDEGGEPEDDEGGGVEGPGIALMAIAIENP
jgi:hypothetical protein